MKKSMVKQLLGFLFMVLLGLYSVAQEKEDPIRVKITREVDGEPQTFEKSYSSEEEMREDKDLREFMGSDQNRMSFWFSNDDFGFRGPEMDEHERRFLFEFDEDMVRGFGMIRPDSLLHRFPPDSNHRFKLFYDGGCQWLRIWTG